MSAQFNNAGPWKRRWLRWRFHLSALVLLIPVFFFTASMNEELEEHGLSTQTAPAPQEQVIGPWIVRLSERSPEPPQSEGDAGHIKPFSATFCASCVPQIRAAYLRIGKPRDLRTAGSLFHGSRYSPEVEMVIPPWPKFQDRIWLTAEGWDGSVRQTSWPIEVLSPSLHAWLRAQGRIE